MEDLQQSGNEGRLISQRAKDRTERIDRNWTLGTHSVVNEFLKSVDCKDRDKLLKITHTIFEKGKVTNLPFFPTNLLFTFPI